MNWMLMPLKRYAEFRGRSRRKEFWMWVLFLILATVVLSIVDSALGLGGSSDAGVDAGPTGFNAAARATGGVLTGIFTLAVLVPNIAVQVRRLHDTDRSGWWLLAPFLLYVSGLLLLFAGLAGTGGPVLVAMILIGLGAISAVVLLVFFCLDGTRGPNRFGPDPKDPAATADLAEVFR